MSPLKFAGTMIAVLLVGAALGYWIAHDRALTSARSAAEENGVVAQNTGRKVLYWHDPMVPGKRFNKPGKSPFMDMPLVPVYADDMEGGPAVRVDPVIAQNLGIRLGKAAKAALRPKLVAVGSVAFDERRLEVVQARVDGYITRLHVKAPLERVKRGQALAEVVAPEWLAAQEEYVALLSAQSERGQAVREAARRRLEVLGVPRGTIRTIEANGKANATSTILAPSDGVVTELAVREGASFTTGSPLFRINGLHKVWVNAEVPEAQVSMVPAGSNVQARANAWPSETFHGQVIALLPQVDLRTRTMTVRIEMDNPQGKLSPGMFLSLELAGRAAEPQIVVPTEAVIRTGERNVVIIAHEGGGYDVAEVTVGPEWEGKTAILSGLHEGQAIVTSGQFLIDSEASLKSTLERLTTSESPDARPEDATESHP